MTLLPILHAFSLLLLCVVSVDLQIDHTASVRQRVEVVQQVDTSRAVSSTTRTLARLDDGKRLWGVNIHYTSGLPGESLQLSKGYRIARMDYNWASVEHTKGQYDFTSYTKLWTELQDQPTPVNSYWILDYGNPLYDNGAPPTTPEAVDAFVKFAVASLSYFKGKGIVWELWNEPNGGFWPPKANATAYSILAIAVGKAIRGNSEIKGEVFIGPATSGIDLNYLEILFQHGVLDYFDGVSVHPYRGGPPESVLAEYVTLEVLITKYSPVGKNIPVISGEWGWPTCLPPCAPGWPTIISDALQGKYLSRQWLSNTLAKVPISIYYDFIDDGPDPTQREQNFGTLHHQYYNASLPHLPKPSFQAAVTLQNLFSDLDLINQITNSDVDTYILAFGNVNKVDVAYALWKTSTAGLVTFNPITPGCFVVVDIFQVVVTSHLCTVNGSLKITGSDSPVYALRSTLLTT